MFLFSYSFRWILRSFGLIPKNKKSRLDLFFYLDVKESKDQDQICSFALMQKNQKIKAYTPKATNSLREAKISENSPLAQTTEISSRFTRNLLYAFSVRPSRSA